MTPLRPAAVTRTQAAFANALAAAGPAVALAVGGRSGTLLWEPRAAPFEPLVALDLTLDGMPALLLLDSDPVATLLELPLAAADLAQLPPGFQAALVAEAVADLLDRVASATGLAPDARALLPAAQIAQAALLSDPAAAELGWRIVGEDQQTWLRGAVRLSANLAQRITELAAGQPATGDGLAVDRLPLAARIELGRTALTTAELGGLEPGDVVLVERHRWGEAVVAIIISAGLRYAARVDDNQVTILAQEEAGPLNQDTDAPPADGALSDIEEVTVAVTFDLGQLELAIGELRRVREGYVLDLQRPLEGAVALRVNGRLIGRGELVDIEGSLGVRVIEIFPRDHG
jgi:type III secretion protein Q